MTNISRLIRSATYMRRRRPLVVVCLLLAFGWGVPCAAQVAVADADARWARVLHRYVNDRGQVDFWESPVTRPTCAPTSTISDA